MAVHGIYISDDRKEWALKVISECQKASIDLKQYDIKIPYGVLLLMAASKGLKDTMEEIKNGSES